MRWQLWDKSFKTMYTNKCNSSYKQPLWTSWKWCHQTTSIQQFLECLLSLLKEVFQQLQNFPNLDPNVKSHHTDAEIDHATLAIRNKFLSFCHQAFFSLTCGSRAPSEISTPQWESCSDFPRQLPCSPNTWCTLSSCAYTPWQPPCSSSAAIPVS